MSSLLTQSPGDTVQTGTGKADPARKFKFTKAAHDILEYSTELKYGYTRIQYGAEVRIY